MSGKGVRQFIKKKQPRVKDEPGSRRLVVDKKYKPPKDDTKRIWLEVWQDEEIWATGDLVEGWVEACRLLDNPELEVLATNHDNKDGKYFYTWLVQAPEGKQSWIVHFNRTSTDLCCFNDHKGFASIK